MNHQEYHILLSKFSHEVRNPAALITSFLQLLAREYPEITACSYYRQIQENLQLLRQLLDEISHYSNASRISPKPADFQEFLQEMAAAAKKLLAGSGIRLQLQICGALPPVSIDHSRMLQVFYNLLRNAREAMPEGGDVCIDARPENGGISVTVRDSGPAIPEEYLPTLFEPMVTHKQDGTGLGLAICREILLAHGGSITAARDGQPLFTLRLPALDPSAPA